MRRKHDGHRQQHGSTPATAKSQAKYKSTPRLKPPLTAAAYTLCTRSAAFYSIIISSSLSHVTMFPFTN